MWRQLTFNKQMDNSNWCCEINRLEITTGRSHAICLQWQLASFSLNLTFFFVLKLIPQWSGVLRATFLGQLRDRSKTRSEWHLWLYYPRSYNVEIKSFYHQIKIYGRIRKKKQKKNIPFIPHKTHLYILIKGPLVIIVSQKPFQLPSHYEKQ